MLSNIIRERAQTAAIHAASLVKTMQGTPQKQDTAAIHARDLVLQGKTGATAVESGYRVAMGLAVLA